MNRVIGETFCWVKQAEPEQVCPNVTSYGMDKNNLLTLLFEEGTPEALRDHVVRVVEELLQARVFTPTTPDLAVMSARTEMVALAGAKRLRRRFYKGWEFKTDAGEWV